MKTEEWREFYVQGWGPDYTDTIVTCHLPCPWERTWDDRTTLGEIAETVQQHLKEVHSG